jgi:hypothetical protein
VGIAVILQIFLQVGKASYIDIIENKETFQRQEQQKTSKYSHYRQYGTIGIWLKFIPHANCILFFDSTFDDLLCNQDSSYTCNIYTPVKGRKYFANRSRFLNFSVMFLLFGVLGCLVYGMDTTVKKDYLKFISILSSHKKAFWFTIMTKLIILFSAALVMYAISLMPMLVFNGINLFSTSFIVILVIILLFLFFFSIGGLIGLIEKQVNRVLVLFAVYFFSVIFLPWAFGFYSEISAKDMPTLTEYDFKNFNVAMKEDEYLAKKHGLPKANEAPSEEAIKDFKNSMRQIKKNIRDNEDRLKSQSLSKINNKHTIASFCPTLFYFFVCENNSSIGVNSQIDFHTYCLEKKDGFVDFIIENSFQKEEEKSQGVDKKQTKKIENFIKGDEDLFFAKPKLPYNFWLGVFLTPFYSVLLLFLTFRIFKKRQISQGSKKDYRIEKEKYNPVFVLCENESIKEDIFNQYKDQGNTVCLEKINTSEFRFYGVRPHELFSHLCQVSGVDEKKAGDNLVLMGIRDLAGLPFNEEIIYKIYAAVLTASDFDLIVINDFVKKESREFENDFFRMLLSLEKSGKKILYLSTQMQQTSIPFPEKIKIKGFKEFQLYFKDTSLR